MSARPAGSASLIDTPVAASGPMFVTVTVNVTTSPTFGRALLTVLVTARSACRGAREALAVLLAGFGSNWSDAVTVAVFVAVPGVVTRARRIRSTGWSVRTVP